MACLIDIHKLWELIGLSVLYDFYWFRRVWLRIKYLLLFIILFYCLFCQGILRNTWYKCFNPPATFLKYNRRLWNYLGKTMIHHFKWKYDNGFEFKILFQKAKLLIILMSNFSFLPLMPLIMFSKEICCRGRCQKVFICGKRLIRPSPTYSRSGTYYVVNLFK